MSKNVSREKKSKHDEIIRSAFENPLVAKEFFEMHLPAHIQSLISIKTLKMEKDSFVGKDLKKSIFYSLLNLVIVKVICFCCSSIKVPLSMTWHCDCLNIC